jgi:phytanoyl-CoA hydroxylase
MSLTALGPEQIKSRLYPSSARVIRPLADPSQFTDAHVQQYREQGFLAIENVFTPEEVAAGKAGLTHLIKGGNPDFKGVQFESGYKADQFTSDEEREAHVRKCMTFVEYESRLYGLCYQQRLLDIVRRLVDSDITMIQDMALLKPAHVGREKPWHQDTAYFLYEPLDLIVGT